MDGGEVGVGWGCGEMMMMMMGLFLRFGGVGRRGRGPRGRLFFLFFFLGGELGGELSGGIEVAGGVGRSEWDLRSWVVKVVDGV